MPRTLFPISLLLSVLILPVAAEPERPIAIISADSSAQVIVPGRSTQQTLRAGMVLFAGDMVLARAAPIDLDFCPTGRTYEVAAGSLVHLGAAELTVHSGTALAGSRLPVCTLPLVERTPLASTLNDSGLHRNQPPTREARIAALDAGRRESLERMLAAAGSGRGLLARVARAVVFEESRLLFDAIEEYRSIRSEWRAADWTDSAIARLNTLLLTDMAPRRAGPRTPAAPDAKGGGKLLALLIGISRYKPGNGVDALRFADRDAGLFRDFLKSPRGGEVPDDRMWLLQNEEATRDAIDNALNEILAANAGGRNTLLLFVAAHGRYICTERDPDKPRRYCNPGDESEKAFILTYDSSPEDPKLSGYPMDSFYDRIIAHADVFERVLVYVDVCHAGYMGRLPQRTEMPADAVKDVFSADRGDVGMLMATPRYKGKRALRDEELAYESKLYGGGHGIFTYFVVNGLNKEVNPRPDGIVAFEDLAEHVEAQVKNATGRKQLPTRLANAPRIPVVPNPVGLGIELPGITPVSPGMEERMRRGKPEPEPEPAELFRALRELRSTRGELSDEYIRRKNRVRVSLEEAGQEVLLEYLRGDQDPVPQERFRHCARMFEMALTLAPDSAFNRSRKLFCEGRALVFDGNYEEAERQLELSIRIDAERAYAYNALGIAALEQVPKDAANLDRASRAFEDARRFAPYWAYPLHNLALAQAEKGEFEMAIRSYQEAMRLAPGYSYLPYNLGLLYQRLNRIAEARAVYSRAVEIAENRRRAAGRPAVWSEFADPLNALATLAVRDRDWSGAERLYARAREHDPENVAVRHNYALLLAGPLKRPGDAEAIWRAILNKDPKHEAARLSLAESLTAARRIREAMAEFRRLLEQRPEFIVARRSLALLHIRAGEPKLARRELEDAPKQNGIVLFEAELADIDRILAGRRPRLRDVRDAWRNSI